MLRASAVTVTILTLGAAACSGAAQHDESPTQWVLDGIYTPQADTGNSTVLYAQGDTRSYTLYPPSCSDLNSAPGLPDCSESGSYVVDVTGHTLTLTSDKGVITALQFTAITPTVSAPPTPANGSAPATVAIRPADDGDSLVSPGGTGLVGTATVGSLVLNQPTALYQPGTVLAQILPPVDVPVPNVAAPPLTNAHSPQCVAACEDLIDYYKNVCTSDQNNLKCYSNMSCAVLAASYYEAATCAQARAEYTVYCGPAMNFTPDSNHQKAIQWASELAAECRDFYNNQCGAEVLHLVGATPQGQNALNSCK